MIRKVAQWMGGILLSVVSILIYLLLFQTHLFSDSILRFMNASLFRSSQLQVEGHLHGGLLRRSMGIADLRITQIQTGEAFLTAHDVSIHGWQFDWNTKDLTLEHLALDQYVLNTSSITPVPQDSLRAPPRNRLSPVIIEELHGSEGLVTLRTADSTLTIEAHKVQGGMSYIDGFLDARIQRSKLILPIFSDDTIQASAYVGLDDERHLSIQDLKIVTAGQSLDFDMSLGADRTTLRASARKVRPQALTKTILPPVIADMSIDYSASIEIRNRVVSASGTGEVDLNGSRIPFHLARLERGPAMADLDISFGSQLENLRIIANRNTAGEENANITLFRFDPSPLLNLANIHLKEPIGKISIRGFKGEYVAEVLLESFLLNDIHFDSFESDLTYSRAGGVNIFGALATQNDNWLNFKGPISKDTLALTGSLGVSDFSFVDVSTVTRKMGGEITSTFTLTGVPDNPRITAEISPNKLTYDGRLTLTGAGKLDISLVDGKPQGNIALKGNRGIFLGDSLKSYNFLGHTTSNGFHIEDIHLQGVRNLLSLSGEYDDDHLFINKLNIIRGQNQLRLADTVRIIRDGAANYSFPNTVISFNSGGFSLSGAYSDSTGYDLATEFELIDVRRLLDFFKVQVDFAGLASGSARITGSLMDPVIDTRFTLKRGVTLGYPSDSAIVDLRLTSLTTISNNIDALTAGGSLNLEGRLPWGYKVKAVDLPYVSQNFAIKTQNYRLRDLKFTEVAGIPISGRATGSLSIRGTPGDTKMDMDLTLQQARFDTLNFSEAYSQLSYEGNLLTIDTLSMISTWGYGTGSGFMPISLDLIAPDRMAVASRDMGLEFEFNLNEMPFLTDYISSLDAIQGDFIGTLGLTGPFNAPVRNGKVRGHNGRLELSILGNPITDIHAEVTVVDNTLSVDHFTGEMNFSGSSSLNTKGAVGWLTAKASDLLGVNARQTYAGDIAVSGTMDLTSFFKPRFDIAIKGKEVYYRSTDGLIEAIANADMTFTGQDTLSVEAVIPVLRAAYYADFESQTIYEEQVSRDPTNLFKYSLNTQFVSDLLISNDQLEAEFEGELWLLDYGDGIMRFSGALTVQEGGKFYYLGNELTLTSGEIIFNSVDFNPQINMDAEIYIDGQPIRLSLTGDLLEPELIINTENSQLTQSDVLTYLTLNKTLVEVSFDETALDPVKTYGEILMEKQISKLTREYIGLDLVGIDLDADSTANARFQIGQRVFKNFMVTYEGALQPAGGVSDNDFGFEYQINQNVSVTSKFNLDGEVELNGRLKFTY